MTALLGLPVGSEWLILLVVALLLFGGSRVAGMGKGAGRAIREFREEIKAPTGVDTTPTGGATPPATQDAIEAPLGSEKPVVLVQPLEREHVARPVSAERLGTEASKDA